MRDCSSWGNKPGSVRFQAGGVGRRRSAPVLCRCWDSHLPPPWPRAPGLCLFPTRLRLTPAAVQIPTRRLSSSGSRRRRRVGVCAAAHLNLLLFFRSRGRTRTPLTKSSRTWMKMVIPKWTSKNLWSLWQLWLAAVTTISSRMQPSNCQAAHEKLSLPVLHMLVVWIPSLLPCAATQFTSMLSCKNKSYCAYFPVLDVNFCSFVEKPGFKFPLTLHRVFSLFLCF